MVPPRPNLGPEPWRDAPSSWLAPVLIATATVGVIVAAVLARRGRASAAPESTPLPTLDDSAEGRLLALCDRIRASLAARVGPSLRARTTEEVAADPRVAALLGEERLGRIAEILSAGDRVKFASRETSDEPLERLPEWTSWADEIAALPGPRRGAGVGAARQSSL